MKRGLLIGGGVVVAVIAGVAVYLYASLESLILEAVEAYGSEVTQVEVKLDAVELDLASGKGALRGLKVGNPEGFETPSAFELGAISIALDTGTVADDVVVIREIVIDKPEVTYELGGVGNNIDAIRRNIDAYMARHGLGGAAKEDDGPKLIIEDLYVRGGIVRVSATVLQGKVMTAPLPDIHLEDIGKDDGGASPGEIVERVMTSLGDGASKAVGGLGVGKTLDSLKQSLGGVAEGVAEGVPGVTEGVGDAAKGVGREIGAGVEKAGEKLKGLFGN